MMIAYSPRWIAVAVALLCILAPAQISRTPAPPRPWPTVAVASAELLVEDPIDGQAETEEMAGRRRLGVIIENFPAARPQWGLSLAERVYEATTEGGITRYLVIFGHRDGERVGPVRSARTQFLDYALELDAALAHVGGNADALDAIGTFQVKDLDQFRYAVAYRRVLRPHLALEHTMFASTRALRDLIDRHWGEKARPAQARATIDFSFPDYRVSWLYRPATNDYQRFLAGAADVDAATGALVTAKAIGIAVVPRIHGRTRIREDTWTFEDIGSGRAWVLQDGRPTEGQWRKASRTAPLRFFDASGRELAWNRGRQWIEIVPPELPPLFEPAAAIQ